MSITCRYSDGDGGCTLFEEIPDDIFTDSTGMCLNINDEVECEMYEDFEDLEESENDDD